MISSASNFVPLIPILPLIGFVVCIFLGKQLGRFSAWFSVLTLFAGCLITLSITNDVLYGQPISFRWLWLSSTDPMWSIGITVDGLAWLMMLVVTSIGTAIAVYSIGYMNGDPRFNRYFAYFSLFCASMLGLVMANHLLLLYACWELVGLCSFLLISFWFEKPAAVAAGRKAFITTRIGDLGLLVAILWLAFTVKELRFDRFDTVRELFMMRGQSAALTWISILIFFGAVGKSAQIPLHTWLPDAMEGPTPASALIHAATMVAAGVYLVARSMPLFTPESLQVILIIGLATHLLAGTIALTMTDIKKVLAYSTISQLGLMMTALGLGAVTAAMFHLAMHAFFKALLFMGAGSVIHATHSQELSRLGGLFRRMPITGFTFLVASLSMGGAIFLSGFWSKDAILIAARETAPWVMWALLVGAVITSAYIFRLYFRCFHGPAPRRVPSHEPEVVHGAEASESGQHTHESPAIMWIPLVLLAIGAAFAGLAGSPWLHNPLYRLLGDMHGHHSVDIPILVTSSIAMIIGVFLAWWVGFKGRKLLPSAFRPLGNWFYSLAFNKYYVDEFYQRFVVCPFMWLCGKLSRFDGRFIDGAVNGIGSSGAFLSQMKEWFDRTVVDGFLTRFVKAIRDVGMILRGAQTGLVQHYLLVVILSIVLLSFIVRF